MYTKLELAGSESNKMLDIDVLQKFSPHALFFICSEAF